MLIYSDFYDIAEYCCKNWRGKFTPKEIAVYAYDYLNEFHLSKMMVATFTISELLCRLDEDGSTEAVEWANRIREELEA